MYEKSDDDIPSAKLTPPIPATQQASHSQLPHSLRPSSAPSFGLFGSSTPSISDTYQPPSHMWRNVPPASSLWGSQSVEYMGQYDQQSFQHSRQHDASSSSTNSAAAATAHHHNHPSVYCAQVLRDQPSQTQPSDYCCSDSVFDSYDYVRLSPCAIINDHLIK